MTTAPADRPATADLLEIRDLITEFKTDEGLLRAVDGVSIRVPKGGKVGLIGESGCGKSVTALTVLRLIPEPPGVIKQGQIIFDGRDLLKLSLPQMRKIRGARIAMIFQEPMSSLNPVFTVGDQIGEALRLHRGLSRKQAWTRAVELLHTVGIPDPARRALEYPGQLSGGMCQRAMIAMALSCKPDLLIADEPTTALDVTIQAQILDLIQQLVTDLGMSLILITHDLGVVAETVESVYVMYTGKVVEQADVRALFQNPLHPYTRGLLKSLPGALRAAPEAAPSATGPTGGDAPKPKHRARLNAIPGLVPSPLDLPPGCPFQERCDLRQPRCHEQAPALQEKAPGHWVSCFEV